jgi:DNA-binding transcriptional LysR family regulator
MRIFALTRRNAQPTKLDYIVQMIDVRRLPAFREVARRGSFAAAADALWLTPSAISQQMAALEREVGSRLFVRNHRGVRLTVTGTRLLAHADALLERLAEAEADLEPGAERPREGLPLARLNVVFAGWR